MKLIPIILEQHLTKAFNRALVFSDLHFGMKSNSHLHNKDCLEFIDWATKLGQDKGCDRLIFSGDWHHQRSSISIYTLSASLQGLEMINDRFDRSDFITGNHDLYYRDKRTVASVSWAKHIPNIHIHNDIFKDGDMVMIPWLVGDEYKKMHKISGKHIFGHFELPHFKMNAMVEMPDHGELQSEDFTGVDYVWTGHFHKRQEKKNINYIGNCFPHNYADAWDDERGCMILDWDGTREYHRWPGAPSYKTLKLSSLLNDPDYYITPSSYLRVYIDIPISYEEANFIRETFFEQYQPRELALLSDEKDQSTYTTATDVRFESVDQIVSAQLTAVQSDFYDSKILMDIYQNL